MQLYERNNHTRFKIALFQIPNFKLIICELHVARMGEDRGCTGCWWGSLMEGDHWGDQDVDGRVILRWIFRKLEGSWGLDGVGSG